MRPQRSSRQRTNSVPRIAGRMCALATADCNCNTIVRDYESTGMREVPGRDAGFHIGTRPPEYVANYTYDAKGRMGSVEGPGLGAAADYARVTAGELTHDARHAAQRSSYNYPAESCCGDKIPACPSLGCRPRLRRVVAAFGGSAASLRARFGEGRPRSHWVAGRARAMAFVIFVVRLSPQRARRSCIGQPPAFVCRYETSTDGAWSAAKPRPRIG